MLTAEDFAGPQPIVSGAMHYFRIQPQQWPHRLRMLRAMGANCVETYVPWNLHERRRGELDFTGMADLEGFLTAAHEADLAAIVRPGPYICAEWENGGLPVWLRADNPTAPLRCADQAFLAAVDAWFDALIPRIAAHQADRGGNVIAVQIENEYGSYGSDAKYLWHLAQTLTRQGITAPLFTSDGPTDSMLTAGSVPGALATANFGSRPGESFAKLDEHRPGEKKWCMEFWNGWFDHWGEKHHVRDPREAADTLDEMLAANASVNIYMAHGGTNFGTWAGANHENGYQPTVTSYDYDAPIDESGRATPKYHAFRQVIGKYLPLTDIPEAAATLKPAVVELTERVPLLASLPEDTATSSATPPRFEQLGLDNGLVLYRHQLRGPREIQTLAVDGLADRAQVFKNGTELATIERDGAASIDIDIDIDCDTSGAKLELLVESMGRVNFGPLLGESKGITGGVRLARQTLHGWSTIPLPLDDISWLDWDAAATDTAGPVFHRGQLTVAEPADGFLALPGWSKGYIWVNGFCLGRYWDRGPQQRLYLPWPLLRAGDNEIVVLELHPSGQSRIEVRDRADLGEPAAAPAL